jgi:hypothetical protein
MRRVETYMAVDTGRLTAAMEHAAENCALINAGGCATVDAGILPYMLEDVMRAITGVVGMPSAKRVLCGNLESRVVFTGKSFKNRVDVRTYSRRRHKGWTEAYILRSCRLVVSANPSAPWARQTDLA